MPRTRADLYSQSALGDCGHIVGLWPTVAGVGGKNPEVICDECTREQWGIPETEDVYVWVRLSPMKEETKPGKKGRPKKGETAKTDPLADCLF